MTVGDADIGRMALEAVGVGISAVFQKYKILIADNVMISDRIIAEKN